MTLKLNSQRDGEIWCRTVLSLPSTCSTREHCPRKTDRQAGRQETIIEGRTPHSAKTCFKDRPTKSLPAHPSARVDVGEASNHLKSSTSSLSSSTGARYIKLDWEIKSRHSPMTGMRRSNLASRYQFDDDQISVFYVLTSAIRIVEALPLQRCKQLTTIQKNTWGYQIGLAILESRRVVISLIGAFATLTSAYARVTQIVIDEVKPMLASQYVSVAAE